MTEELKPYKHDEQMDSDYYKHPTFGMIHFSRYSSSNNEPMFGSNILHNGGITLTISHAEMVRSNNNDRYHDTHIIVEVAMSPTQFADAITNLNNGCGIPVTIKYIAPSAGEDLHRLDPPVQNKVAQFNQEFKEDIKGLAKDFDSAIQLANETHAQKRLIKELELLKMRFASNLPFVNQQFTEQMEHTLTEAKAEVEAFVNATVTAYGIEAIRNQAPQLPEVTEVKEIKEITQGGMIERKD